MNLYCPGCGLRGPLESFIDHKEGLQVAALVGRIPPALAPVLLRYIGLFAPAQHVPTFSRIRRLLDELVPMIEAGRIRRARRDWPVSLAQWEDGLRQMVERRAQLTLPLKSHGYLLEVLAGAVDKIEAQAENEAIKKAGSHPRSTGDEPAAPLAAAGTTASALMDIARARRELGLALAANKKLGITASHDALRKHLAGMGHGAAAIDHALQSLETPA